MEKQLTPGQSSLNQGRNYSGEKTNYEGKKANNSSPVLSIDNENVPEEVSSSQARKAKTSRRKRRRCKQQLANSRLPSSPGPVLLRFRRDRRVSDNLALIFSLEMGAPVIPVFLWCPKEEEGCGITIATGGASKYWLHHALLSLNQSLGNLGSHLGPVKVETSSLQALQNLVSETGAGAVVATALYEPWLSERDESVLWALEHQELKCSLCHSYCLRDPHLVNTKGVGLRGETPLLLGFFFGTEQCWVTAM
ncbi:hypothetical protein GN956_G26427 [Arapaima gigas]